MRLPRLFQQGRLRAGRPVLVIVLGCAFVGFALLQALELRQERERYSYLMSQTNWASAQLEVELHRFLAALDRYALGDETTSKDDVLLRYDLLWSRIPVVLNDKLTQSVREITGARALLEDLENTLRENEAALAGMPRGDTAAYRDLRGAVEAHRRPVRGLLMNMFQGTYYQRTLQALADVQAKVQRYQGAVLLLGILLIVFLAAEVLISRRRAELAREARAAAEQANAAKSRFLANMSHELRTPLNAILGFSDMQRHEVLGPLPPRYRDYAEDIHTSATHLLTVINDILDMARVESGRFDIGEEEFDPAETFRNSLRIAEGMAKRHGHTLTPHIGESLAAEARLHADRRLFQQMILNLTANAIKFTPQGGRIECSLWHHSSGGMAFEVADNGPGMTPDVLRHVTNPFYQADQSLTREHEGSGLGLALVKSFAEAHDATLTIDSTPGSGTRARIVFPPDRLSFAAGEVALDESSPPEPALKATG